MGCSHKDILELRENGNSEHNNDKWSDYADKRLKRLYDRGYGISEMALKMGRTENSIFKRIKDKELDRKVYDKTPKGKNECLNKSCKYFDFTTGLCNNKTCINAKELLVESN